MSISTGQFETTSEPDKLSYMPWEVVTINVTVTEPSLATVQVNDPNGNPIIIKTILTEDEMGSMRVRLNNASEAGKYGYFISVTSTVGDSQTAMNGSFIVRVESDVDDNNLLPNIPVPYIAISVVLMGMFGIVWLSERGRYLLISLFVIPLYSRIINRDIEQDVSQQNNRGRIYQHIKENQGTTLTRIRGAVETGNGTTVYHLKKLQRDQIVIRKGKQYYLKSARPQIFGKMKRPLKLSEENIVQYLRTEGKANESIMGQHFDREQPTINRDLKSLMTSRVVTRKKTSGAFHYSLTSTFEKWHEVISREQQQQMIDETRYVEPMICPSCGKEITLKGATFCPFCSRNLK